jgi:hypothetical protein
MLVAIIWDKLLHLPDNWVPVVIIPYMLAIGFAAIWKSTFICPRCKGYFFAVGPFWFFSYHNPYSHHCLNCDLPEFARFNPGEDAQRFQDNNPPIAVKVFDFAFLYLTAFGTAIGLCLFWEMYTEQLEEIQEFLWPAFMVIQATSVVLSGAAIASIRKPKQKQLMKMLVPALGIWVATFFLLVGRSLDGPSHRLMRLALMSECACVGLLILYVTHRICRRVFLARCPNDHEVPPEAVRCPTCGTLLP